MRKTRRITYKKTNRKNKTIKCRKNTRRCKYRRKRALYGGVKETKYHSGNIFDNIYQLTNKTPEDDRPLFNFAGRVTQARRVPDGVDPFANDGKITPAKEKNVLKGFKDEDLEK